MILLQSRKTLVHFHKPSVYFSLCFSTSQENHQSVSNPPSVSDFLIQKHQISPKVASRVALAHTHLKDPEKLDSVISFFKNNGFSMPQLENVLKTYPSMLRASPAKTLKPKFTFFQDLGFSDSETVEILSKSPWILRISLSKKLAPAVSALNGLLGNKAEVKRLLMASGWFLNSDLEKTLVPNVEYLLSCGVGMDQIRRFLCFYPMFFLRKPEDMKRIVARADGLGIDRSSGMFITAARVVSSMTEETWERKLQGFRELGFREDDILKMLRRAPFVFPGSLEKFKKIKEILLSTGEYTLESIVSTPTSLSVSLEKRYKPRLRVLEVLKRKNLIKEWPSLGLLYTLTDEKFVKRFVAPHLSELHLDDRYFIASDSEPKILENSGGGNFIKTAKV